MKISSNKTCVFCGKRLDDSPNGLTIYIWYPNDLNEGDWGVVLVHKACVEDTIVRPMIDDGDGIIAPLSESNEPE